MGLPAGGNGNVFLHIDPPYFHLGVDFGGLARFYPYVLDVFGLVAHKIKYQT